MWITISSHLQCTPVTNNDYDDDDDDNDDDEDQLERLAREVALD